VAAAMGAPACWPASQARELHEWMQAALDVPHHSPAAVPAQDLQGTLQVAVQAVVSTAPTARACLLDFLQYCCLPAALRSSVLH